MRLMIVIFLIVLAVIVDQTQFRGYYFNQLFLTIERSLNYITR
jgi:hypothetical protein